ncbi:Uncharacterised protein [Burkholderia pseudomallei]|uniref:hypothetical protein n=1 Tax=Burkholderia pseudomallei TaxID=28450 RepID=UPI00168B022F|nr:hypothetical protein [Burkholderia pseudomallei]MBD2944626.1 hypothetical protein [Burkholderia pseudomallei]MBD2949823.1 hypothetical protein [Burkholderia pseudomallei]MBD2985891.1 hypothetical protein [Burkholderia pseudomallei]MBD2994066.1 hypothetical protein [Burkholderia pseudomallei]CAJ2780649.1 Uncharacterised protein [Burkholderia pseudomallei]
MEFNFKGLHPVFLEAVNRHEPSVAFALAEGKGRFVFLLFMATDSAGRIVWGELELFILLAGTQKMLRFKLLGNHKIAGDFKIRLTEDDERAIRAELGIGDAVGGPAFALQDFLNKLNGMIPTSIPLEAKVAVIRDEKTAIEAHCKTYLDDASKVYLLAVRPLPDGRWPREETLRKLYMLDAEPAAIAALIRNLRRIRWTTYWTATEPSTDRFAEIFAKVAGIVAKS